MANNINLLSNLTYVEVPYIKVTIGNYTFGVYKESVKRVRTGSNSIDFLSSYKDKEIQFPNYIKSLTINKVNGAVNEYTLNLEYTITEADDPNFFEKVFSSVSKSRKITFSYGDLSTPNYIYKNEEAIITDVKSSFTIVSSRISYTVSAVSTGKLLSFGTYPYFPPLNNVQPSDVIINMLLKEKKYGLLEVFYGMRNTKDGVSLNGSQVLIPRNDKNVDIEAKSNITVLEYLKYLVNKMAPRDDSNVRKNSVYVLTFNDDVSGDLQGPYFQITNVNTRKEQSDAYEIDIGYQNKDVIFDFNIDNDENYSIYYDYVEKLNNEKYVQRLNEKGEIEEIFAPVVSSGNDNFRTREEDKSWWTKMTSFPIKASIKIKGLLRPSMLMTHIRLNVLFYGKRHIASGLYVITKEVDSIDDRGFITTLNLVRIGDDFVGNSTTV